MKSTFVPTVKDKKEGAFDLYSKLLKERTIFLFDDVNEVTASVICASLLYLDNNDSSKEIYFYINSPGGSVDSGLAIYDTMNIVKSPIVTVCSGLAASMGSFLLAGGSKGHRYITENSRVMLHQVSAGTHGHINDMEISVKESSLRNKQLMELLAKNCNQPIGKVLKDCRRDFWLSAEEAIAYGVVDKIAIPKTGGKIT